MPSRARRRDGASSASPPPAQTHLAGQVMWLPWPNSIRVPTNLEAGCYNHPVVILSPRPVDEKVVILMATSLQGHDLLQKFPDSKEKRVWYLPIHPSKRHPDLNKVLKVENGLQLRKKSYVNTKDQHTIPFEALRVYARERPTQRYVLTSSSYQILIDQAGFSVPIESPVHQVIASLPVHQPSVPVADRMRRMGLTAVALGPETVPLLHAYPEAPAISSRGAGSRPSGRASAGVRISSVHNSVSPATRGVLVPPLASGHRLPLPTPHSFGRRSGSSFWSIAWQSLAVLSAGLAIVGGIGFGAWKIWMSRAELLALLWRGVCWLGVHAFWLGKTGLILTFRSLSWLFAQVVRGGKGLFRWIWERL
ncbi:hypothetical protein B0T16DRAFT_113991 [Cercophora newfieldiana]|uniref:Uncharacterized protein n=1 Tax=Cercophora newfieldiana TaxID=92897 RepID=A0AA40CRR3_9PEZI|nr:hypothetical protein B0T16DRAFT_113991 [Cercophora newfieldiana]